MKYLVIIFGLVSINFVQASENAYEHRKSGLLIQPIEGISKIDKNGDKIRFEVDSKVFILNAFLLPKTVSGPNIIDTDLNTQFSNRVIGQFAGAEVLERSTIEIDFSNRSLSGSLFKWNYTPGDTLLCELNIIHSISNNYFLNMTLTTPQYTCEESYEYIVDELNKIYTNIVIPEI